MDKKIAVIVGVVTLVIFGIAIMFLTRSTSGPNLSNLTRGNEIIRGSKSAPNKIVEFSDYECPGCAAEAPILADLVEKYPEEVQVILRQFPIPGHQWSRLAAKAAEAAGKQGKFWEMNDKLFSQQKEWQESEKSPEEVFTKWAEEMGLNKDKFTVDMGSKEVEAKIQTDFNDGVILGVTSTPTFFVNGEKLTGGKTLAGWEELLQLK